MKNCNLRIRDKVVAGIIAAMDKSTSHYPYKGEINIADCEIYDKLADEIGLNIIWNMNNAVHETLFK